MSDLDTAVLADLERKHVPFACSCGGRRWVEDENWTPDDPRHAERTKHDGLIPCGSCNLGGWATPENAASEPWCAEDNQDWPCDAAALLAEVVSLRKVAAMLPDELTRLADLLEAKVPLPSNRTDYFEGWLDAIRAVQDELRSLRAALVSGEGSRTR